MGSGKHCTAYTASLWGKSRQLAASSWSPSIEMWMSTVPSPLFEAKGMGGCFCFLHCFVSFCGLPCLNSSLRQWHWLIMVVKQFIKFIGRWWWRYIGHESCKEVIVKQWVVLNRHSCAHMDHLSLHFFHP